MPTYRGRRWWPSGRPTPSYLAWTARHNPERHAYLKQLYQEITEQLNAKLRRPHKHKRLQASSSDDLLAYVSLRQRLRAYQPAGRRITTLAYLDRDGEEMHPYQSVAYRLLEDNQ